MSHSVIYLSLIHKNTIMGVSQNTFAILIAITFSIIILNLYLLLLFIPLIYQTTKIIYDKDEMFFEIYRNFSKEMDFWDPWQHELK